MKVAEILKESEDRNIEYLSDVSMNWFYSTVSSMQKNGKDTLKREILKNSEKSTLFLEGRFYYFDYFPKTLGNRYYERYDRNPFVYAFEMNSGVMHGFNINYLPMTKRIPFINKIFRYVIGDYTSESVMNSRIALDYDMMKKKSNFYEQNIIYRKYLSSRGSNFTIVPIKYVKIFSVLDNISNFGISEDVIYKAVLKNINKNNKKRYNRRKREI